CLVDNRPQIVYAKKVHMKLLANKYFIFGNIFLILLAIPLTLFFVKKQQETRSRAAASTILYFVPDSISTTTACQSFKTDITVNPGENEVAIIDIYINYDSSKLKLLEITPSSSFSDVIRKATISSGKADISLSVGGNIANTAKTITKVATLSFHPVTSSTVPIVVSFDATKTRVLNGGATAADAPYTNLLSNTRPANINIAQSDTCTGDNGGPTPTLTTAPTPTAAATTPTPTPTAAATTPTPTLGANVSPVCTDFSVSPSATGTAPFSVLLTAKGNDPDGVVAKTTFNFGDGQVQDVTAGMNLKSVTVQTNHTYNVGGTFNSSVTFTDNRGAISQSCSKTITASGSGVTSTPTKAPTPTTSSSGGTVVTATPIPTIAPTGSFGTTIGIIGAVVLALLGGVLLLAL
ncbi:MAG: hypothetical protein COX79_00845, partial [Candidatus Levybacteria bacterium CG_4_10_14_0_2_um_filter_36_16]